MEWIDLRSSLQTAGLPSSSCLLWLLSSCLVGATLRGTQASQYRLSTDGGRMRAYLLLPAIVYKAVTTHK